MKQKLFTLFLALITSMGLAHSSDTQVDGLWYDFNATTKTASVTYHGSSYDEYSDEYTGSIVIPPSVTYNEEVYSVTSIGEWAFESCTGLTSIQIPNSVTSIGDYAFYGCSGLSTIAIGNGVTSIGNYVFVRW